MDTFVSTQWWSQRRTLDTHTNCANDAGSAMALLWHIVDVEVALPFQLCAVGEMVQSVTHIACVPLLLSVNLGGSMLRRWERRGFDLVQATQCSQQYAFNCAKSGRTAHRVVLTWTS